MAVVVVVLVVVFVVVVVTLTNLYSFQQIIEARVNHLSTS